MFCVRVFGFVSYTIPCKDIGQVGGHLKCLALDIKPSDDDAFHLLHLKDDSTYFAILTLFGS